MSGWHFRLRQAPALRVDLRGITPAMLAGLPIEQVERLPVGHGNTTLALAELFDIAPREEGVLHFEGLLAACEMAGGTLTVEGDVGDFAASTLPGSMDGMRGGTFIVRGNAGERFGDRMRRGTALVHGDVGAFLGSRMVAGTIAVGGRVGAHAGHGMRRGSVVFAGPGAAVPIGVETMPTFVANRAATPVFWALLARDLARHGGAFGELPARRIERHLGDLAADGKGELIYVNP